MLSRCLKGHGHEWIFAYLPFFFNPFQSAQCAAKKIKKDQESMGASTMSLRTTRTGCWFGTWILFFHILGMSSSQLTFTPSFFRGVGQPPTRYPYIKMHMSGRCYDVRIFQPIGFPDLRSPQARQAGTPRRKKRGCVPRHEWEIAMKHGETWWFQLMFMCYTENWKI